MFIVWLVLHVKIGFFLSSTACFEQVWYVSVVEFIITTSARPCLPARTLHNKFFAHNRLREDLFSFLSPRVVAVVVFCLALPGLTIDECRLQLEACEIRYP